MQMIRNKVVNTGIKSLSRIKTSNKGKKKKSSMLNSVKFLNPRKWLNIIFSICKTSFYNFCGKIPILYLILVKREHHIVNISRLYFRSQKRKKHSTLNSRRLYFISQKKEKSSTLGIILCLWIISMFT